MNTPPFDFAVQDCPLAPATLYKVGGNARWALVPRDAAEAIAACTWMLEQADRHLILGRGSNVLISDEGFPGYVLITTGLTGIEALGDDRYRVEGGVDLDVLVREVIVPNDYHGAGALTGIPGSVGGAIYMNAGTVNGATCDFLESVDLAGPNGVVTAAMDPSKYAYRSQAFCTPDDLILQGVFRFEPSDEDQLAIYNRYIERRSQKQPRGDCCGSVFKNPESGHAGQLIEACGLKGKRRGGAVVSPMHANFIMNEDNATFEDIVGLIGLCKQRVREQFGIELQEEVRIVT
ncbi:MAG: UDP-N-acetylmuramate dehydrogenase [Nitrospiraceae bacterium]|nr:UDP-N-acetylmuramate dehydrogenase [Nitrospiraceae bacterium]